MFIIGIVNITASFLSSFDVYYWYCQYNHKVFFRHLMFTIGIINITASFLFVICSLVAVTALLCSASSFHLLSDVQVLSEKDITVKPLYDVRYMQVFLEEFYRIFFFYKLGSVCWSAI